MGTKQTGSHHHLDPIIVHKNPKYFKPNERSGH